MDSTKDKKFGSNCLSMFDEQSITHYMSKTAIWTNMDINTTQFLGI
jgi:hypothetical protein